MSTIDSVMRMVITTAMRPFVRLLLRYGVSYADLCTVLKKLFVDIAAEEFKIEGRKQSHARIAVLTGLTRREVKKIVDQPESEDNGGLKLNRAFWALSGWSRDNEFVDNAGQPKALSIEDTGSGSFQSLIKKYSGDVPFRAILDELLRVGAITKATDKTVVPVSTAYVPANDSAELLRTSFQSVADHISTIDYNDQNQAGDSRLQLTVHYDNVTEEGTEIFKQLSREKSNELLVYLDRFLATQDRDVNTNIVGKGCVRTGLSVFYFEDADHDKENSIE